MKVLRHDKPFFIEIGHERSLAFPAGQYLFGSGSVSSRVESGSWRHTISMVDVKYYNKIFPVQTLAGRCKLIYGNNLDRGWQYVLGEDEGLRGYQSFHFSGQKLLLLNFEDRIFSPWEILWTGIGAAVFVDGGYIWQASEPVRFHDIRWSAGVGLRLGLTKSTGSRVIHIDIARAFDGSGYLFSISSDHVFLVQEVWEKFRFPGIRF